ncbi:MAG: hypothetical protein E7322_04985 [Clostridiales bacterium]|nr:hypothetical protein [Clostridiales bacterium]
MIARNALNKGKILSFPGMDIEIVSVLGQGSNAIVYKGSYKDALTENAVHTVLVKELFPFHPKGLIYRNEEGKICVLPEAQDHFALHLQSFERGNKAHLKLLELFPDKIGGNVNTYSLNGTHYTVLSESGGRDINASERPKTLKILTRRMLSLLDALSAFHETNLMHLDVSPDNILLVGKGENERCMLIDYNSAFSPQELCFDENAYFSVKQGFTSPEVINKNYESVSWGSDLYSVAAVFFFMLMNRVLTLKETLQKNPPDVSEADLLKDAPETVVSQVKTILKKGLSALPARRYKTISEMREAFSELMRRIDMLGVTHASLWEAGKKSILKLTRENPFYEYLTNNNDMFPVRLTDENGNAQGLDAFIDTLISEEGQSICVVSGGGMGKTTLLLKCALSLSDAYLQAKPAAMYVSLAGKKSGERDFLLNEILKSLRFTSETVTYDGARHQLLTLLSSPINTKNGSVPTLILLLDGLNEATGDKAMLVQEIAELNKLSGLRILISSRTEDESVRFARVSLSELNETDITDALKKRGLLLPENKEIQSLLKTPLMLSLFVKASGENAQLTVNSEADLLDAYILSLLQKEKDALGDDEAQKYRIEAAANYVLCAIALKCEKAGGAITETEAFETVRKCRKTLLSRNLSRAFPAWIGHRNDICLDSPDTFYGEIVHNILVSRMGLIVRLDGNIKIAHAKIGEYLSGKHAENEKRIQKRKCISACAIALSILIALLGAYASYEKWFKDYIIKVEIPKIPYDDKAAENCLTYAVNGYTEYGSLYDAAARLFENGIAFMDSKSATMTKSLYIRYIDKMMASEGEVVSWSKMPFDGENAKKLIVFADECREIYAQAMKMYELWRKDDRLKDACPSFEDAFRNLVNADAVNAVWLYQVVCAPHQIAADDPWQPERMKNVALSEGMRTVFDRERSIETGQEALQNLVNAEAGRQDALTKFNTEMYKLSLYTD